MSWYNPQSWFNSPVMTGRTVGHTSYSAQKKRFFSFGNKEIYFSLNDETDYLRAYKICAPVKAIVNKRAGMFINGNIEIINKNTGKPRRGEQAKLLRGKLKKPNAVQSWDQFFAQFHIYIDLFGYCPILKVAPAGMEDEISALWCLPPWLFNIEFTGKFMNQVNIKEIYKTFKFKWGGVEKELDKDSVAIILDSSIGTDDDGNMLMPDARLKSMEYQVSNILAAYKSRNTLITKKGAIGILSNIGKDASGPVKLEKKDKDAVQEDFARYGLTGQEWQVIVTDASLQWQAMTMSTKDLMLFEEIEDNILRLCDGLGLYSDLMGAIKKSTFANLNEAKKAQYQDYIIPEAKARLEQLSDFIFTRDAPDMLYISYDHLEVLQESEKERADTLVQMNLAYEKLYQSGLCTKDDWAMAVGLDKIADGDKFIGEVSKEALVTKLGIGGLQALQSILESGSIKAEQKKSILILVFGLADADAEKLKGEDPPPPTAPGFGGDVPPKNEPPKK